MTRRMQSANPDCDRLYKAHDLASLTQPFPTPAQMASWKKRETEGKHKDIEHHRKDPNSNKWEKWERLSGDVILIVIMLIFQMQR